jgi:hypothetical protein
VSYKAGAVTILNATSSLVRFEKNLFSSSSPMLALYVVVKSEVVPRIGSMFPYRASLVWHSGLALMNALGCLFLLSEAQPKNAIVNPPPKFGNDCQPRQPAQ